MKLFSCHHRSCSKSYTTPYTLRRHVRLKHKDRARTASLTNSPAISPVTVSERGTWTSPESGFQTLQLTIQDLTRLLS